MRSKVRGEWEGGRCGSSQRDSSNSNSNSTAVAASKQQPSEREAIWMHTQQASYSQLSVSFILDSLTAQLDGRATSGANQRIDSTLPGLDCPPLASRRFLSLVLVLRSSRSLLDAGRCCWLGLARCRAERKEVGGATGDKRRSERTDAAARNSQAAIRMRTNFEARENTKYNPFNDL